jgi:hypothetical protein
VNELSLVILMSFPPQAGLRIRAEEVFGDFVLLVFFRAPSRDLGTDANAKVAGAVGPGILPSASPIARIEHHF